MVVDASRPAVAVATLLNGTSDASIFLENAAPGQQLQIMTRDGRQILGTTMSSELQATVLATDGMTVGAQYSTTYLNKTGDTGYKDMIVFYGAKAEPRIEPVYDSLGLATSTRTWGALLEGGRITTGLAVTDLGTGTYTLNAKVLNPSTLTTTTQTRAGVVTTTVQANNLAAWINAANTAPNASGVTAVASNEIHITTDKQLKLSLPLTINGIVIGVPTDGFASKTALANQIEERKAETGVTARINGDGILILSNISGQEGRDIQISSSLGTVGNALGIANTLYGGVITLSRAAPTQTTAVVNTNQIRVAASQIDLSRPLAINGNTITKPVAGFPSIDGLIAAINSSQTAVTASKTIDGDVLLTSTKGPDNNSIQIATDSAGVNATGNALGLQANVYRAAITTALQTASVTQNASIEFGFGSAQPSDLAKFGFRTGAYISGAVKDDLLVFVTGQGASAKVAASYAGKPVDPVKSARA